MKVICRRRSIRVGILGSTALLAVLHYQPLSAEDQYPWYYCQNSATPCKQAVQCEDGMDWYCEKNTIPGTCQGPSPNQTCILNYTGRCGTQYNCTTHLPDDDDPTDDIPAPPCRSGGTGFTVCITQNDPL